MANNWWREPDMGVMSAPVPSGEPQGCAAMRMWRNACNTLVAPDPDGAWKQVEKASPPESLWHTLRNCVAYQAGVWQNLLNKGMADVIQPAAFKLAIVLRHTPSELTVKLLSDLLRLHPQSQDLTSYILALLTDDEATFCGNCNSSESVASSTSSSPSSADEESSTTDQVETDQVDTDQVETDQVDTDQVDTDQAETDAEGAEATDVESNEAAGGPADSASAPTPALITMAPPPFAIPVPPPVAPDSTTPGESNLPDSTTADDPIDEDMVDEGGAMSPSPMSPGSADSAGSAGSVGSADSGDSAGSGGSAGSAGSSESAGSDASQASRDAPTPAGPAPLRDLQLFGDCELAVLAASREEYDAHAKLVRAEYSKLTQDHYVELRIKVLNQFNQIPKLFHTPEFECFESAARENIEREIFTLREHLLTGRKD